MRLQILVLVAGASCHPSATVENTMPIANLQTYRSIALRVHSTAFAAQGQAMQLESAVLQQMQQRCSFQQVAAAQAKSADLVLDLNIVNSGRGGGGFISNSSTARLDTLLVISGGQDGELLGTARIHGESSGMIINNAPPELEAIDIVAKTAFQQADALLPDPKYKYNLCSTLGLLEKWDEATAMCQKAIAKQPPAALRAKLDQKIELLQHHQ